MMMILHPTYTLRIEVQERPPEPQLLQNQMIAVAAGIQTAAPHRFHNALTGKLGCDEVLAEVKERLKGLPNVTVWFEKFEHKA